MYEVHLQWIAVAVHLVLAAAVEVNLDQREGLAVDGHGAARAGTGHDGVAVVDHRGPACDVVEARILQGPPYDLFEVHW